MAKMDTPGEPLPNFTVSDLSSFESKNVPPNLQEFEPVELNDVDFALNRLSHWAHPAAISHILEVIGWDLTQERQRPTPSIKRLRELLADPRYAGLQLANDPYDLGFENARAYVESPDQVFALDAVQKLHQISLSSELHSHTVSPHIKSLVEAILADTTTPTDATE